MKLTKFVDIGDPHGDELNQDLAEAFFAWKKDFRPKLCVHGGDNWNFAALRKKASPDDKAQAISPDYVAGNDFLKRFFDGAEHRFFLRGNHDERIYNLVHTTTDAAQQHYATKMVQEIEVLTRKLRVNMIPYESRLGVLDYMGYRGLHGYASGVNAARKFAASYGTCAFHHTHSMDVGPFERWPEVDVAYGSGAMCILDQPYNGSMMGKLRHENGWIYGYTDGVRATYFQARWKDGRVHVAEGVKTYGKLG